MIELKENKNSIEKYLRTQQWLNPREEIQSIEKPGEGNMNFTQRIITDNRSFILKQSRDYVEKFPQVGAPEDRILMESSFYTLLSDQVALQAMTPAMHYLDEENNVMLMEDLGSNKDFTDIYQKGINLAEAELNEVIDFAAELHNLYDLSENIFAFANGDSIIRNHKMRALNHEHIFIFPYVKNNGLDLNEIQNGLGEVAEDYINDKILKKKVNKLGEIYLADGDQLLHGDYFPGSWLKTDNGIYIIDPEFCFFGPAEFDIGVTLAHLKMADQPESIQRYMIERYTRTAVLDEQLMRKYAGIEVMRRILGLAQLPLEISLDKRRELLIEAADLIKS